MKPFKLSSALFLILLMGASPAWTVEKIKSEKLMNPYSKTAGDSFKNLPPVKKGGTLYTAVRANPHLFNPLLSLDTGDMNLFVYLYARLLDYDRETNEFFPCLAEKVEASKDRKEIVFTLRKDATWEDGSPLTADDAEFTFKTMMDPHTDDPAKKVLFAGYSFEKINDHQFRFRVEKPAITTLSQINVDFLIIQKKQFVNEPDFNKSKGIMQPVTSGPYRIKSYTPDQALVFERKKDWWGFKLPYYRSVHNFDSIVFRIIPDAALVYEKFIKGEIDVIEIDAETFGSKIMGSDKDKFADHPGTDKEMWARPEKTLAPAPMTFVAWYMKRPYFSSKKTRQALAHLIDYDEIISKVYHGLYLRPLTPFGTTTPNFDPEQRKKAFNFDPAKAIAMLKEDGWSDPAGEGVIHKTIDGKEVKFEFTLRYNSENSIRAKIAQMVKEQFKKAGIIVNVQALEWNTHVNEIDNRNDDAFIMGWGKGSVYRDAKQIWHSKSFENKGSNFVAYFNPEADALIEQSIPELNPKKRYKIMQKLGSLIYEDQPYAFIAEIPGYLGAYHSKVKASKWSMNYDDTLPLWLYYAE